jgi:hypothetical protein
MTPQEVQLFQQTLERLQSAYEAYRRLQEQEHAHLNQRGSIVEWNILVRQKQIALQTADDLSQQIAPLKQKWQALGEARRRPEYANVRTTLEQLQPLLTRILTCDRMNETLLYNGGYLQSVVAHRSMKNVTGLDDLNR